MDVYIIVVVIAIVLVLAFIFAVHGLKKNFQIVRNELKNSRGKKPVELIISIFRLNFLRDYFFLGLYALVFLVGIIYLIYKGVL